MTNSEVRKAAKQSMLAGKTKQETFESLKESSQLPTEDLAKIIRSIPSLSARVKYRPLNLILVALLLFTALLKLMFGIPLLIVNDIKFLPLLIIMPVLNVLLLWGVATFRARFYNYVAVLTILGLMRSFGNIVETPPDPIMIIDLVIAAGLIGLSLFLNYKLFPRYMTVKERYQNSQGQDKVRDVIKFAD
jgi:hypothetical protein